MKELLNTTDPTIIPFARSALDAEGIESFVLDVHMSALAIVPQRLMVSDRDFFMAKAILRDLGVLPNG
ncbi:MAG: DUF2007 domain-containing protein [Paracoccaceae bacterium]